MTGKVIALHPPSRELPDEFLLRRAAHGEPDALGVLFDRHHLAVYRFLMRLVGASSPDLDDLVQGTFLEVHRAARRFRGQAAVLTWIMGVAANVARHHVRGEIRRRSLADAVSRAPVVTATLPEAAAAHREAMVRLAEGVASLRHDLRVAFVMCDLEEVPGVEAARALGVPEGTLWRRLHEARRILRRFLAGGER
jgi:RNA polymerase sigma-70 factor (ECF subfamily)